MKLNDFDYDVMQKKRLSRGARYKKNGSRTKYCSLPSDGMTQKQWKERNGRMLSINMNKPIEWRSFKTLTKSTQREYIQNLLDKYGISVTQVADMFGVSKSTIYAYIANQLPEIEVKHRGGKMSKERQIEWNSFLSGESCSITDPMGDCVDCGEDDKYPDESICSETQIEPDETNCHADIPVESGRKMSMSRFAMQFSGDLDMNDICNSLKFILGTRKGTLNITFELE